MGLEQKQEVPKKLHFQWEGKLCGEWVYIYKLVAKIKPNELDPKTKKYKENAKIHMLEEDEKIHPDLT
jgi:hypothetical protein|tara:strand:+ start:1500 stop:1703 length:204 start_codon:yes stop_codon:yes gene_type:complete